MRFRLGRSLRSSDLRNVTLRTTEQPDFDRPFELSLLYQDELGWAENYLIRYRVETKATPPVTNHRRD